MKWKVLIDGKIKEVSLTPLRAIRLKCVEDCCCGSSNEVRDCAPETCALWPYRFGKQPKGERVMTAERKAKLRANLQKAREAKKINSSLQANLGIVGT